MLAFNVSASSLELANSGAVIPAKSSVYSTGFPDQRVSLLLCGGVRELNPFAARVLFFVPQAGLEPGLTREVRSQVQ
jgi:hypothetical protein